MPDDCLGFHIANEIEFREMGLLYYIQASSGSLGEALRRGERYCSIQNEGVKILHDRRDDFTMELNYKDVRRLGDHHQMECFVTMVVRLCRQLTGRHLLPTRIELAHRRPAVPSEVTQFFGCEVIFGSHRDEIHFPLEVTQLPIASADMYLRWQDHGDEQAQRINRALVKHCPEPEAGSTQHV